MDDVPARSAARLRLFARGGVMGRMIAERVYRAMEAARVEAGRKPA